jgi:hypothetical protein
MPDAPSILSRGKLMLCEKPTPGEAIRLGLPSVHNKAWGSRLNPHRTPFSNRFRSSFRNQILKLPLPLPKSRQEGTTGHLLRTLLFVWEVVNVGLKGMSVLSFAS